MTKPLPIDEPRPYQPLITVLTVIALITTGWMIGSRAGGLLVDSAAEVPDVPERAASTLVESAPAETTPPESADDEASGGQGVVPEKATIADSMEQAGMSVPESEPAEDARAVSIEVEAGDLAAEQQCGEIEQEISLRWDDGRLSDEDYDARWEGFLTEEQYKSVLVPSLGASGGVASAGDRPLFEGFPSGFVVEELDNNELITGGDNCWELLQDDLE